MSAVSVKTIVRLACFFLLLLPGISHAVDTKIMGFTDTTLQWADTSFSKDSTQDRFAATQRSRIWVMLNASPDLRGTLMLEIDNIWGKDAPGMRGGQLGTDGMNIGVKESFIDWRVPDTSFRIRAGLQSFLLPGIGVSNPFTREVDSVVSMWARGAGIIASGELTDNLGLTGFWMRPSSDNGKVTGKHLQDDADIFGLILPIRGDGFDVKPWVMFSRSGKDDPYFTYRPTLTPAYPVFATPASVKNPSGHADGWWGGIATNITRFDPWRLGLEVNYAGINGVVREMDRAGWYASALAEYALDSMIPGILAWYSTGDDANPNNGSERMPTILGNWYGSSMGFAGQYDNFGLYSGVTAAEPTGTWGVSLYLRDMAFLENMKQTARVLYYQGTNSNAMAHYVRDGYTKIAGTPTFLYLTKGDSVVEVNLTNTWQISNNLSWCLEAGLMHLKRSDDWDISGSKPNAVRLASTLRYMF